MKSITVKVKIGNANPKYLIEAMEANGFLVTICKPRKVGVCRCMDAMSKKCGMQLGYKFCPYCGKRIGGAK